MWTDSVNPLLRTSVPAEAASIPTGWSGPSGHEPPGHEPPSHEPPSPRASGHGTSNAAPRRTKPLAVVLVVIAVAGALTLLAFLAGRAEGDDSATGIEVVVTGQPLPRFAEGFDPAVGMQAPGLAGFSLRGEPLTITADGRAKAIYFLAHWCPHCQVELPKLVDLVDAGLVPDDLDVYLVSTAVDPTRGNYPPSDWFAAEGWDEPVLDDSTSAAAFRAFGGSGFPFGVYVDADNTIVTRTAGEMPPEAIAHLWSVTTSSS